METTPKVVWIVLGVLITVITIILLACMIIEPKAAGMAALMNTIAQGALDAFKIIVGAVAGALGTTVGMKSTEGVNSEKKNNNTNQA